MRLSPLRHKWFAAFTGSVGLGGIGDEVARLALPLLILDLTHSIAAAAALRLVQALPYVFFGGIAGVLIDRADKRKLLIACDALSVALTLALPVSVAAGVFSLNLLYAIGFLLGTVEVAWGVTTDFSVVPALVEPDELTSANAAYFGVDRTARILGPTIGGLAIAALGTANAMYIAALAFVPTLVVFFLMPPIYETERPTTAITPANIAHELGEGFAFVWRSKILRWLLVLMFIANLGQQGIQTLVLYVLREENHLDEVTIGLALSLAGAVTVLASFIAPRLAQGRPLGHTLLGSAGLAGLVIFATAFVRDWRLVQCRNTMFKLPLPSNRICGCSAFSRKSSGTAPAGGCFGSIQWAPSHVATRRDRCWCKGVARGTGIRKPWSLPQFTPDSFQATHGRFCASSATDAWA